MGEIEESETLSVDEKRERIQELEAEYAGKSQKMHVIHQLLKAYTLFHKDERYIIGEDGQIVIVDLEDGFSTTATIARMTENGTGDAS